MGSISARAPIRKPGDSGLVLLLHLLMLGMQLAPFAVLLEVDLPLDELAVLSGPIVDAAAFAAGELE